MLPLLPLRWSSSPGLKTAFHRKGRPVTEDGIEPLSADPGAPGRSVQGGLLPPSLPLRLFSSPGLKTAFHRKGRPATEDGTQSLSADLGADIEPSMEFPFSIAIAGNDIGEFAILAPWKTSKAAEVDSDLAFIYSTCRSEYWLQYHWFGDLLRSYSTGRCSRRCADRFVQIVTWFGGGIYENEPREWEAFRWSVLRSNSFLPGLLPSFHPVSGYVVSPMRK